MKNTSFLIEKKLSNAGMRMGQGYPNPLEMGMRFDFSSPLGIDRVTYVSI